MYYHNKRKCWLVKKTEEPTEASSTVTTPQANASTATQVTPDPTDPGQTGYSKAQVQEITRRMQETFQCLLAQLE